MALCPTADEGWILNKYCGILHPHGQYDSPNYCIYCASMVYYNQIGMPEEVAMYTVTVSAKGWVVIPKPLREKYGLKKGTRVQVVDHGDGLALVPLPPDPVKALHGMLKGGPPLTEELLTERARERTREEGHRG